MAFVNPGAVPQPFWRVCSVHARSTAYVLHAGPLTVVLSVHATTHSCALGACHASGSPAAPGLCLGLPRLRATRRAPTHIRTHTRARTHARRPKPLTSAALDRIRRARWTQPRGLRTSASCTKARRRLRTQPSAASSAPRSRRGSQAPLQSYRTHAGTARARNLCPTGRCPTATS